MKSLIIKVVLALASVAFFAGVIGTLAFTYFNLDLPKIDKLQDYKPNLASQIISSDGVILAELGLERREIVEMSNVPTSIVDAFLSAEDDKFFEHKGVDYWGLTRAMLANFKAGKVVQGGSTITQQVAKSLLLSSERSITRKIKDFILAQRIEEKLTKKEILYLYLNQVYLGGGYYGVKAAARGYYNKDLKNISIAESAMLAGLLVAPGKYSPYVNSHAAKMRQGYVLERMHKLKKITLKEYEAAVKEKIVYHLKEEELKAGYFTEWVRQKVVEAVGEKSFLINGFKIKTTLDWDLQKTAEREMEKGIKEIDKRQGYKGPIAHIGEEEFSKFEKESRKKLYRNSSNYFTLDEKNDRVYEFVYDEEAYDKLRENSREAERAYSDNIFLPGLRPEDTITEVLKEFSQYEAVVTRVDDFAKIIYISVAGSPGIIPFEYFKWAHKRSINENTSYYQEVSKPSSLLRKGDLIHVQVIKKSSALVSYLSKEALLGLSKTKNAQMIRSQKYIICQLDQVPEVQGALFSIDAKSGNILSYIGGNDFSKSKFNRVIQAKRQPGSSFKPLLFAAALEHGYNPATIIMDTPEAMPGFDSASSWKPQNYDREYKGPVTMRTSLEESRNIPTIKIADKIGVGNILKFADRIGFNAKLDNNLSIALGSFGVSPRDMVLSYAVMANGGNYVSPHGITSVIDRDGKKYTVDEMDKDIKIPKLIAMEKEPDEDFLNSLSKNPFTKKLSGNQVYDPRLSYLMTSLLRGVITSGTGAAAKDLGPNVAGKTGTTSDYIDAWFVGFTPNVVSAVWAGFDDNKTLGHAETGGRSPVLVWKEYMRATIKKFGDEGFLIPEGITQEWIDKKTGKKAMPNAPGAILEFFADGGPLAIEGEEGQKTMKRSMGDEEYFENQ